MDDEIFGAEKVPEGGDVGGVATDEHHTIVGSVHVCQGSFQLTLPGPLAGHRAARGRRCTVPVDGVLGRL